METVHYISSDLVSIEMINEIISQDLKLELSEEARANIVKCRTYLNEKLQLLQLLYKTIMDCNKNQYLE